MRPVLRLAARLAVPLLLGAGCSLQDGPAVPSENDPPINPAPLGPGRIFIAWTIDGRAPDPAMCEAIDQLALKLAYPGRGAVTIKPIPCVLDRFRYDGLYVGDAELTLTGFDAKGCVLTTGAATTTVGTTQPATPSPTIALPVPGGCP